MAALAELVDGMARSLDRLEVMMKRQHFCSAIVVRQKPGGGRSLEECRKLAIVRRSDGKGFYCASHARQLLPKPAGRYVTRGA